METIDEIIDYVIHTPNNSNPNVMRGILGKGGGGGGDDKTPMVVLTYLEMPIRSWGSIPFQCTENTYEVDINLVNYCIENKIPMFLGYSTIPIGVDDNGFSIIPLQVFGPHGSYESGDYEYIEDYTFNFDYAGYHYNLIYHTDTSSFSETIYNLKQQWISTYIHSNSYSTSISFQFDIRPEYIANTSLDISFFNNCKYTLNGFPCDLIKISYTNQATWNLTYRTCDKTKLINIWAEAEWEHRQLQIQTRIFDLEPICTFTQTSNGLQCDKSYNELLRIISETIPYVKTNYGIEMKTSCLYKRPFMNNSFIIEECNLEPGSTTGGLEAFKATYLWSNGITGSEVPTVTVFGINNNDQTFIESHTLTTT